MTHDTDLPMIGAEGSPEKDEEVRLPVYTIPEDVRTKIENALENKLLLNYASIGQITFAYNRLIHLGGSDGGKVFLSQIEKAADEVLKGSS